MPATSVAQRRLFALAAHHPEKLRKGNKHLTDMPKSKLLEFASVSEKGLPKRKEKA